MSKKQFDFIGKRKLFLLISVGILLAGIIANIFMGTQLDITFKGGAVFTYAFSGEVNEDGMKAIAKEFLGEDAEVSISKDISGDSTQVTFTLTEIPSTVLTYQVNGTANVETMKAKAKEVFGCEAAVEYDAAKNSVTVDPVEIVTNEMVEDYTTALASTEAGAPVYTLLSSNTVSELANQMYTKMVALYGTKLVYNLGSADVTSTDVLTQKVEAALVQKVTQGDAHKADMTLALNEDNTLTVTPSDAGLDMDDSYTKMVTETLQLENSGIQLASANYNAITLVTSNSVKATVGKGFFIKCLFAMVLGGLFLTLYIGIRFRKIGGVSAGIFATFALIHDILIAYMAYVIFQIPLNDNFIAVVLTILGYSINGTIVIYDRIRENERKYGTTMDLNEIVNASVNQTFTRNVFTTISTLIAVTCIAVVAYIKGLDSIISFAFPMAIGLLAGFYSSVLLSSPMWAWWRTRKK